MTAPRVTAEEALQALLRLFDLIDTGEAWCTKAQRRILNQAAEVLAQVVVWET